MKNRIFTYLIILFTASSTLKAQEPAFKFHLAFEDATGAKDTLWLIWDSLATNGYDALFGEEPVSIPNDTFQVYVRYSVTDTGKVKSYPFDYSGIGFQIHAKNYVYPINMYWDTSLIFNNNLPFTINMAILDNEWFFFQTNDPSLHHQYSMMYEDSIQLPWFYWGSQDHFPIIFSFGYDPFLETSIKEVNSSEVFIYPNPVSDQLYIKIPKKGTYQVQIRDVNGKIVKEQFINLTNTVQVKELLQGLYFLELKNEKHHFIQKFIKQ